MTSTQGTSTGQGTSTMASCESYESESSVPRATSSSNQSRSTQQQHATNTNPTPSSAPPKRQGLSANTMALAEELLHPPSECYGDKQSVRPGSSVQWLIETTTEVERTTERASALPPSLTEAAIRTFNKIEPKKKMFVVKEEEDSPAPRNVNADAKESGRTKAWIMGETDI